MPSVIGTAVSLQSLLGGPSAATVAHDSGGAGNGRKCLVAGVGVYDSASDDHNAPTYNGVTMTLFGSSGTDITSQGIIRLYYLVAPANGSNTFSITRAGNNEELEAWIQTFDDVNQTTPMSGLQTTSGNGATATIPTITLPGGSDWGIGFAAAYDGAGTAWTESDTLIGEVDGTAGYTGFAMQRGNADLSWSVTNTPDWLVIGGALIHDGGGSSQAPRSMYMNRLRRAK